MRYPRSSLLEIAGAICVMAIGGLAIWEASNYPVGELTHMGPGYFPIILGVVMIGIGLLLLVQARAETSSAVILRVRGAATIFGSIATFAFLVNRVGVVPATIALVVISSLASKPFRPLVTILLAVGLAGLAVALFIHGLALPLRAFLWR